MARNAFGISSFAKDLQSVKSLFDGKGFEKIVLAPVKTVLLDPFETFLDSRWKELHEVLKSVLVLPLANINNDQISKLADGISEMNKTLDTHAKSMLELATALRSFSFALKMLTVFLFIASIAGIFNVIFQKRKVISLKMNSNIARNSWGLKKRSDSCCNLV
jgi:hypothetical protein